MYINDISSRTWPGKASNIYLILLFIIQVFIIILFAYKGILFVAGSLMVLFLLLFTAFSVERVFYLLLLYIVIFEEEFYTSRIPGFTLSYSWPIALGLFLLVMVYWAMGLSRQRYDFQLETLDLLVIIFLLLVLISAIRGYLLEYDSTAWRWEILPYPFYLSYFVFRFSQLKDNNRILKKVLLFAAAFVAFEMIYALTHFRLGIIFHRIVTKNVHIMQFAIPYAGLLAIYSNSPREKTISFLLLPAFVLAVIISQQRALMLTIFLTLIILLAIFIKVRFSTLEKRKKRVVFTSLIVISMIAIFVIIIFITHKGLLYTVISRAVVFLSPQNLIRDQSWQIRWQEIVKIIPQIQRNFFLGTGFGATEISRLRFILKITVDNAYFYLLWKMGFLGLVCFLSIQLLAIKRCIIVSKRSLDTDEKIFSRAVLMNIIGLLFVAITNSCIVTYRLVFVWMTLISSIEVMARKYV